MRNNTQKVFDLLCRGKFLSVDTTELELKHLYDDVEENFADYETFFSELGISLIAGDGYFYFARANDSRITIESKLNSFAQWVDILDFLKTYNITFSPGFQFRSTHILERINLDVELRDKARKLFRKQSTHRDVVDKLMSELTGMGFAEVINEQDGTYKVTAAFRYAEELVELITIYNEEDTPEV